MSLVVTIVLLVGRSVVWRRCTHRDGGASSALMRHLRYAPALISVARQHRCWRHGREGTIDTVKGLGLRPWPAVLFTAALAIEVAAVALSWGLEPAWDTALYAVYAVTLTGAGALIVSRHPGHRIGLLFIATGLFGALAGDFAQGWGLRAAEQGWPAGPFGEWLALSSWVLSGIAIVLTFLLFPDGHLTRRGWQAVAWVNIVGVAVALPAWAMDPDLGDQFVGGRNPYAVDGAPIDLLLAVGMPLLLGSVVVAIVPLVQRLRRSSGVERLQLRWFAFASVCAAVVLPTVALLWSVVPAVRPLTALALTAMPVAAGVAILRYRLYDIDLVISRTVAYTAVTLVLAATYAATALVIGAAVGRRSTWVTAGATLAVAAAFGPLRRRVQDRVDRRFAPARVDALRQMTRFLDDLRAGRAAPEELEPTLRRVLGVDDLEVRLSLPHGGSTVDLCGAPVPDDLTEGQTSWPIRHGETLLGTVVAPADLAERRSLVTKVLEAGSLAVEIARLRVELRHQLDEVEASRTRIVAAADDERRRIERDLHDGAQQRLVSIGLALRHAQHALGSSAVEVSRTLDDAVAEITVTIDDLRELARGLRPAALDGGLGAALRDLARRAPLAVEVDADVHRSPPDVETAAYFCACEGLTNAVKHSRATKVVLSARRRNGALVVSVADDGVGGAATDRGSGLTGLADRVAAHGGTLRIHSNSTGTTLLVEFPCAS
jgi:signal transduction histidine kinase